MTLLTGPLQPTTQGMDDYVLYRWDGPEEEEDGTLMPGTVRSMRKAVLC